MSAIEMQKLIITEIRAEYQHNISQQIYVTEMSWSVVKKIKEQTIGIINSAANALPAEASALELSKSVLNHLANLESDNPYDLALSIVKKDIQSLF